MLDPKTDWTFLTEVAWAPGKIPDKRAIKPLYDLDKKLQAIRDPDNVTLLFTKQKKGPTRLAGIGHLATVATAISTPESCRSFEIVLSFALHLAGLGLSRLGVRDVRITVRGQA